MKKQTLQFIICLLIISNGAFAQWTGTSTSGDTYRFGSVGIGTSTPTYPLTVVSGSSNALAHFQSTSSANSFFTVSNALGYMNIGVGALTPHPYLWSSTNTLFIGNDGNPTLTVNGMPNGNVGIGTTNPAAKLDVNFFNPNGAIPQNGLLLQTNSFYTPNNADNSYYLKTLDQGNGSIAFIVKGNGQVGIGTANIGSCKLAVDGRIGARGIKVTVDPNFPDYVFDSAYQLRSLAHLEQYINQNKHLPGIPSAEDVKKEGGIELGDMNVKLLEKIEELTLYVIELKKENELMKKEMKEMKEKQ